MPTFLHVGCGASRKPKTTRAFNTPAWQEVRFDIDPDVEPDIIGTMTDMAAVPTASMDAIFSSHNIEHLYPFEVPLALREFHRVLKPDGFMVLTCPDLQSVAALVAEGKLLDTAYESAAGPISAMDMIYGFRPDLARGKLYMAHRCGFTQDVLTSLLTAFGFGARVRRRAECFDLWAVAAVMPTTPERLAALAAEHFPSGA